MMKMKSIKDISWNVTEEEYRADKAFSYSTLAKFNREGFDNLEKLFDKVESPSLLFGSMVDTLLTDGQEEFDNRFVVSEFPDIPDSIIKIVKYLFNIYNDTYTDLNDMPDSNIIEASVVHSYQLNWKPETRAKVIREKGNNYYKLLYLSIDKVLVSNNDYLEAQECVNILKNDSYTKWYFADNNPFDDVERFYQLKFKGTYLDIPLRCMADLIIVNHKDKTIIPCDLKTSFKPEWKFYKSFIDWNYWIQAQLYWYIIRQNLNKDEVFKDYKLLNYRFIVISKNTKKPLIWEYPDTQSVKDCVYGKNKNILCKNWRSIVQELHYYMENDTKFPIGITEINNLNNWLDNE